MKRIPLTQGQFALVDDADFEKVGRVKWSAMKVKNGNFYAVRNVTGGGKRTMLLLHCEILEIKGVDHLDGNGLNCCRENLRPATTKQNAQGFRHKSLGVSSRFRGVCWYKKYSKWLSQIMLDRKNFFLGYFLCEEAAARAYDSAAKKLFGEFARLNFPNE